MLIHYVVELLVHSVTGNVICSVDFYFNLSFVHIINFESVDVVHDNELGQFYKVQITNRTESNG